MKPITDLTGKRPKGKNPYLPTGVGKVTSVAWCDLQDDDDKPLLNKEGKPYGRVVGVQLEGGDTFYRVPRLTPRYTETLAPVLNGGEVLDLVRQALDSTSTYEEAIEKLVTLVGKTISVTRTPQKLVASDLSPYIGTVVKVEFVKKQAQPQTPAAQTAAQQRKGIVALSSDRVTIPFIFQNAPIRK